MQRDIRPALTNKVCVRPMLPLSGGDENSGKGIARVGVLTVSDRASAGIYEDLGGPEIIKFLEKTIKSR